MFGQKKRRIGKYARENVQLKQIIKSQYFCE